MDEKHFDSFTQSLVGVGSRRRLLGLVSALPIGALLSTRILDDVAAGDLGGRHGNNNRGRDKNRHRGRKGGHKRKNKNGNNGFGVGPDEFAAYTRVNIINQSNSTISLSNWQDVHESPFNGTSCKLDELVDVLAGESHLFEPMSYGAYVYINDRYYFECYSDNKQFPYVLIQHGVIQPGKFGCQDVVGTTDVKQKYLGVGQSVSTKIDGFQFVLKREADVVLPVTPPDATTPNERSFILTVSNAA